MVKKGIPQRKRLAAVFASLTVLVVGAVSLSGSMSIDYYSVLNTVQKIIPASFVMGCIGWLMGMVLDSPRKSGKIKLPNLFVDQMPRNDLHENEETQKEKDDEEEKI